MMVFMAEHRLKLWEQAGLIDPDTAARIRAWEREHAAQVADAARQDQGPARGWWARWAPAQWALTGLAALSIGLGVLLLVAANWDAISPEMRLTAHMAVLAAGAAALLWRGPAWRLRSPASAEAGAFIYAMLGLGFLAHLRIAYQLQTPLWQMLLLWLALFLPVLAGFSRSWLTAGALMAGALVAAGDFVAAGDWSRMSMARGALAGVAGAAPLALPLAVRGLARARGGLQHPMEALATRLEQVGQAGTLALASLCALVAGFDSWPRHDPHHALLAALLGGAAVSCLLAMANGLSHWRRPPADAQTQDRQMAEQVAPFLIAGATLWLGYPLSGDSTLAGVLFMALWASIGALALRQARLGLFRLSVALVALRLIILSLEVTAHLLDSGLGFIVAGAIVLAIGRLSMTLARQLEKHGRG